MKLRGVVEDVFGEPAKSLKTLVQTYAEIFYATHGSHWTEFAFEMTRRDDSSPWQFRTDFMHLFE